MMRAMDQLEADRKSKHRRAACLAARAPVLELEARPTTRSRTTARPSTPRASTRANLKELADLAKFPFTTKAELRENYPFGMFAVPMQEIVRVHASSGTTGKPTVVGYTRSDIDTWSAVMARSIRAAGGRSTDIVHIRLRLRIVYRGPRGALRRRDPGRDP